MRRCGFGVSRGYNRAHALGIRLERKIIMATIKKFLVQVVNVSTGDVEKSAIATAKSKAEVVNPLFEALCAEVMDVEDGVISTEDAAAIVPKKYRIKCELVRQVTAAGATSGKPSKSARRRARKKKAEKNEQRALPAAKVGGHTVINPEIAARITLVA